MPARNNLYDKEVPMGLPSQKYINFIANLMPIYEGEQVGDRYCARSLRDGTLLLPHQDEDGGRDDFITIWWQGDASRASGAMASMVASNAVTEYVQQTTIGKPPEYTTALLLHLAQHFEYKTGDTLYLPYAQEDQDMEALIKIIAIAKKAGIQLALEGLKKLVFL